MWNNDLDDELAFRRAEPAAPVIDLADHPVIGVVNPLAAVLLQLIDAKLAQNAQRCLRSRRSRRTGAGKN